MLNKHIYGRNGQDNNSNKTAANPQREKHTRKKAPFSPEYVDRNKETYQIILRLNSEGSNNREISEALNAQGIPSLSGTGKWFPASVGRIINETPAYMKE